MQRRELLKSLAILPLFSFLSSDRSPRYKKSVVMHYKYADFDKFGAIHRRFICYNYPKLNIISVESAEILSNGDLQVYFDHGEPEIIKDWEIHQLDDEYKILTKEYWRIP